MPVRNINWHSRSTLVAAAKRYAAGDFWEDIGLGLGCASATIWAAVKYGAQKYPEVQALRQAGIERRKSKHNYATYKKPMPKFDFDDMVRARIAQKSHILDTVKTLDQKLFGTPPAGRSALDQVETHARNVTKREPGIPLPPVSIPDIRINNNHTQ